MTQDFTEDFGPFRGRVWLDCAHQGPLPRVAVMASAEAVSWKLVPHRLPEQAFFEVPDRLKRALGGLIGVPAEETILGNSASYGIHLLANGLPLKEGNEVLLMDGDFPATVLPWLALRKRGIKARLLKPQGAVLTAEEIRAQITPETKLLCLSWVNSFNGHAVDIQAIGRVCHERDVIFILNGSQAVGARELRIPQTPVDALISCGFKWLCGPYGTGFCWIRPDLRETLHCTQSYWLTMQRGRDLDNIRRYEIREDLGAAAFDVFGTANFFNFKPFTAAVEYLLEQGIARIEAHDNALVSQLNGGIDFEKYELISPADGPARSTLVVLSHKDRARNRSIFEALRQEGLYISLREGNLRIAPHLYNTAGDINRLLEVLNSVI